MNFSVIVEVFGVKKRIRIKADTQDEAVNAVKKKLLSVVKIKIENGEDEAVEFLKSVFGMTK